MTIDEMLAVLQAAKEGRTIQMKAADGSWVDRTNPRTDSRDWDFDHLIYRVKPEPREWWLNLDGCGFVLSCHETREDAVSYVSNNKNFRQVRVREVIE